MSSVPRKWLPVAFALFTAACGGSDDAGDTDDGALERAPTRWDKLHARDFTIERPPTKTSPEYARDLRKMREHQENRDAKACDYVKKHGRWGFRYMWKDFLSEREIDDTKYLLDEVFAVSNNVAVEFKQRFRRERPFIAADDIEPCVSTDDLVPDESYPSGHSTVGALSACVLAKIFPDRASDIRKHGDYQGDVRPMVGVHFPSDVAAGQKLGRDICAHLLADENFKARLRECKEKGKCPQNSEHAL